MVALELVTSNIAALLLSVCYNGYIMKTNGTFKLSKSTKRVLATMTNAQSRGEYKRSMIDAEVAFARAKLAKLKTKSGE